MAEQTKWEVVNPEGTVQVKTFKPNPHPKSLEGKTVLLHWNSKHNGNVFLSRIGELLQAKVKGVKILRSWEVAPETVLNSSSQEVSQRSARTLAQLKPDIVIGAQGD